MDIHGDGGAGILETSTHGNIDNRDVVHMDIPIVELIYDTPVVSTMLRWHLG